MEDAIKRRRSIRSFKDKQVAHAKLEKMVKAAQLAPSTRNQQPSEFVIVDQMELERQLFTHTHWAGGVDWQPSEQERPRAYILILVNKQVKSENYEHDVGLAAAHICLQAVAEGLATCLLGSIEREPVRELLDIPPTRLIDLAIAIGYPDQEAVVEDREEAEGKGDATAYWRDKQGTFHVPKRKLEEITYHNQYQESC